MIKPGSRAGVAGTFRDFAARLAGARGGGAIMAAKGSFDVDIDGAAATTAGVDATESLFIICGVGGGPIGLATSSGFSPGNTHTFRSLS